jgi:hypothetical protein
MMTLMGEDDRRYKVRLGVRPLNRVHLIRRYEQNYVRGWIVSAKRRGRSYERSGEARIVVSHEV